MQESARGSHLSYLPPLTVNEELRMWIIRIWSTGSWDVYERNDFSKPRYLHLPLHRRVVKKKKKTVVNPLMCEIWFSLINSELLIFRLSAWIFRKSKLTKMVVVRLPCPTASSSSSFVNRWLCNSWDHLQYHARAVPYMSMIWEATVAVYGCVHRVNHERRECSESAATAAVPVRREETHLQCLSFLPLPHPCLTHLGFSKLSTGRDSETMPLLQTSVSFIYKLLGNSPLRVTQDTVSWAWSPHDSRWVNPTLNF